MSDAPALTADSRARMLAGGDAWTIEPRTPGLPARLIEVWRHRHLLGYFARATINRKFKRTALGWLWLIIRPTVPIAVNTLVFHGLAGVDSDDNVPYLIFYLVGNSVWNLFEEGLIWTTRSLMLHQRLLSKLYFPRILLPTAALAPALAEFGVHLGLVLIAAGYFLFANGELFIVLGPSLVYALFAILLAVGLALGLGLFTSVLGAETRDIRFTLPYIFRFWFFLTPIAYPITLIPDHWRWLALLNPMTTAVGLMRMSLLGTNEALALAPIVWSVLSVLAILAAGAWFFSRAEAGAIDRI